MFPSAIDAFAVCLENLMKENDFSKRGLSIKSGVSRAGINDYRNGMFFPRFVAYARIADVFQVSSDDMPELTEDSYDVYKTTVPYYEIPKLFSERLQEFMLYFHYSQGKLARLLKMQQATVSKWKRMETMPEVIVLIELGKLFRCSVDFLIGRERVNP